MKLLRVKSFAGIDRRKDITDSIGTAFDMRNLRVTHGGSLEKRAVNKNICFLNSEIEGLWCGTVGGSDMILAAAGGVLYSVDTVSHAATALGNIGQGECLMFEFSGAVYCKTEGLYCRYDGNSLTEVEGYIPLVAISCAPSGEGELYEEINLISDKRRQLFSGDGTSIYYRLAEKDIASLVSLKVDGVEYTGNYALVSAAGAISLEKPLPAGLNNIEVIYSKAGASESKARIMKCRRAMLFGGNSDGRVFLYGNPDYPNYRFYSQLADGVPSAEYFPVNCFTVIGNSKINCIVQQYDRMLIFNKNEAFYSYCELTSDALGNVVSSFPVFSLNGGKGCLVEADGCVIDNRPVTLCDDGLNVWESTSVVNEKNAVCISGAVNGMIKDALRSAERIEMCDLQSEHELFLIIDGLAYIYNYGIGAWYLYDNFGGKYFKIHRDTIYYADGSGIYCYTERGERGYSGYYKSNLLENGQDHGGLDACLLEADVYICGESEITFEIEKSNGERRTRKFSFGAETDRCMRISLRLSQRRALPFRVTIYSEGGVCVLHGITVKTRKKERSRRFGIL